MDIRAIRDLVPGPEQTSNTSTEGFKSRASTGAIDAPLTQIYSRRPELRSRLADGNSAPEPSSKVKGLNGGGHFILGTFPGSA